MTGTPCSSPGSRTRTCSLTLVVVPALTAGLLCAAPPEPIALPDGEAKVEVAARREGNLLFVRAHVGDEEAGWFLVDTGATHVTLDQAVADRLKLPVLDRATARGAAGTQRVTIHRVGALRLGRVTLGLSRVPATDLSPYSKLAGVPVAGLLGHDAWAHLPVTLDYTRPALVFHGRAKFRPHKDAKPIALRVTNRRATVRGVLEGTWAGQVLLDTGHQGSLAVHAGYLARHPEMTRGRVFSTGLSYGVGGKRPARFALLNRLDALGQSFHRLRAEMPPPAGDRSLAWPYMAVVGAAHLSRFTLTLDYRGRKVWAQFAPPRAPRRATTRPGAP